MNILFDISTLFGLLPCSQKFELTKTGLIRTVVTTVLSISVGLSSKVYFSGHTDNPWFDEGVNRELFVFLCFIDCLTIGFHAISMFSKKETLNKILTIYTVLVSSETRLYNQRTLFGLVLIFSEMILLSYLINRDVGPGEVVVEILNTHLYLSPFLILMQFCALQELLAHLLLKDFKLLRTKGRRKMQHFTLLYTDVVKMNKEVSQFFDVQLLMICIEVFINLIGTSYLCVEDVRDQDYTSPYFLVHVIKLMWQFYMLYSLAYNCENTSKQADKFNAELFRVVSQNANLCKNKQLCLYLIAKPCVSFSACGFFSLGYPLITSMIGAATTYLVILFQFSPTI